jgi:hypothetical protein
VIAFDSTTSCTRPTPPPDATIQPHTGGY